MDNGASSYRRFRDDGDENGLVEIIDTYKDGLMLYLNSIVDNIHTAEEVTEDTFVLLGTKLPKFKGKSSFKTWLYAIGRNLAIDHLRKKAKESFISLDENRDVIKDEYDIELLYIKEERKIIVHRAMGKLKAEYRQVLWLIYFEELSTKETAKIMKKNVHNIESLVSRARKSLKSQLEAEGFTDEKF